MEDYADFRRRLDDAVSAGKLDPTQAMILEQQIKYQAMYAYQYQKQLEAQQWQAAMAGIQQMAGQSQAGSQPIVLNKGSTCYTPKGSNYSYCS